MAKLKGSKTEDNLKAAFAGESQANRRYLYFAQKADVEGYNDVAAGLLREVVVEPGRSYFDNNISDHHHFFLEETGKLVDIPSHHVAVTDLPTPPAGTAIRRVDVVIRLERTRL